MILFTIFQKNRLPGFEYGQAFANFDVMRGDGECDNFWPNDNRRNRPIIDGKRAPMFREEDNA